METFNTIWNYTIAILLIIQGISDLACGILDRATARINADTEKIKAETVEIEKRITILDSREFREEFPEYLDKELNFLNIDTQN